MKCLLTRLMIISIEVSDFDDDSDDQLHFEANKLCFLALNFQFEPLDQ